MNNEIVNDPSRETSVVSTAGGTVAGFGKRVLDRRAMESREATATPEESLVVDDRCEVSPAQLVESKLTRMLGGSMLPVSHLQTRGLLRQR